MPKTRLFAWLLAGAFSVGAVLAQPADPAYPQQREQLRARIAELSQSASQVEVLEAMQQLRELARAAGDTDTVNLMDIRRIYMTHEDASIDASLDAMHAVRARVTDGASLEVREMLARAYGNMYFDAGNFHSALRHQLQALALERDLPPDPLVAQLYRLGTIADLYIAMGLPQEALDSVARAEALGGASMQHDNRMQLLTTKAMALRQIGRLEVAAHTLDAAEALVAGSGSALNRIRLEAARAAMLLSQAQPARALESIAAMDAYADANDSAYFRLRAQLLRGHALIELGQAERGLPLMEQANAGFLERGQMVELLDGLSRQAEALEHSGDPVGALATTRQLQALRETLFRSEHARAIAELEAAGEASELAHRADTLSTENRLQEAQLRSERLARWLAIGFALAALATVVCLFLAIRRTRRERDRLAFAVRRDPLTGALSRYQFDQHVGPLPPSGDAAATACVLLDLDHFKDVNDHHGHAAGDAVLRAVVERMQRLLGNAGELYRWGGEEFLLVLRGNSTETIEARLQMLVDSLESRPVPWGETSIQVTVSGGAVFHPFAGDPDAPFADAVRWADTALYHAKHEGRRRIEVIDVTEGGELAVRGKRPTDLRELLTWRRMDWIRLRRLGGDAGVRT